MQSPPTNADTMFEELLQDLPPDLMEQARQFKAFTRARSFGRYCCTAAWTRPSGRWQAPLPC